ncbi:hypothetical protein AK812_SmicGene8280 [Symbiodinium microadriaticum]|uniref:Uncharacterized protein n=1 Tax=Symbiodinium microadriaticum TaxID=2951 RepID=A0A1Q9ELC8_SYMMI|nr:hypothetical protein AK812_SmicGene8280 [Symbiodinium microadriaticum]
MPVPTEVPSPTSPAGPEQEEADEDAGCAHLRGHIVGGFKFSITKGSIVKTPTSLEVPAPDESAVAGSAVMSSAGDVQVVEEEADEDEAAPLVAPPLAPAELVEEALILLLLDWWELPVPVADSEEEEARSQSNFEF